MPVLVAAADPSGDSTRCGGTGAGRGNPPDLVSASGSIVELGTSALWTLRFAEPLTVPDRVGRPFRVDILLHDPNVPAFNVGFYHDVNRIVRYDAVRDAQTQIILIPEAGSDSFSPPRIDGRTMRIQVPGRILSEEEDPSGASPGLSTLDWTVVVRDENTCDVLGNGRPRHPLVPAAETPTATPGASITPASPSQPPGGDGSNGPPWSRIGLIGGAAAVVAIGVGAASYLRRPRPR